MAASSPKNSLIDKWTCTKIKGGQIYFEWTITNFNSLFQDEEDISSPVFPADESNEKWELKLYLLGDKESGGEYLSIYLFCISEPMAEIEVYLEISMMQSNQLIEVHSKICNFTDLDNGYGFLEFVHNEKLSNNNDAMIIQCKIDILGSRIISLSNSKSSKEAISLSSGGTKLSHDLYGLFEDPKFSDFTIIVENEKFKTHKAILASRSTVLSAIFEHKNFYENQSNQLVIEDIKPDVVKGLLEYIYTDEVSNIEKFAEELLVAAEKYDLPGLKNLCAGEIYKTLNKENAAEILGFTDLYNADELKKYVMNYIVAHSSDIVKSPGYKSANISASALKEIITMMSQLIPARET